MELTNRLLRKFNEVEITSEVTFTSVRGLQAAAKDAIKDAINRINQEHYEWPFNAYEHTQVLSPGVSEYSWPDNFKYAEWESFFIIEDDALNIKTNPLKTINREEWYKYHRSIDVDAGSDGRGEPVFVFASHGFGFGVTPSPERAYTIKYRYYRDPPELTAPTDEVIIPSQWDNVIIAIATPYLHEFKSNAELAALTRSDAMQILSRMRGILINKEFKMYEGRVNASTRHRRSGYIDAG